MKHKSLILIGLMGCVLINSIGLGATTGDKPVNIQNILNNVKYLSSNVEFKSLQYRVTATAGEKKAANYIENEFKKNGLETSQQSFNFDEIVKENSNIVQFSYKNGIKIKPTTAKILYGKNINKTIKGKLIDLGKGTKKDFELKKDKIRGKFVLVRIDESTSINNFTSTESGKSVKGIIAYDPTFVPPSKPGIANKFTMTTNVINGEDITTVTTISKKDYDGLVKELNKTPEIDIAEYLKYDVKRQTKNSQNVIAIKKSENPDKQKPLIIVGAHYDCVNDSGADDNASGVASLIELAKVLSSKKLNYDIKFVAFGAEEIGLFGSNYFVSTLAKEDLKRCKLMVNIDGPGLGDVFIVGKTIGESDNLLARKTALEVLDKNKTLYRKLELSNDSDQFYFSRAGIPTITFSCLVNSGNKIKYSSPNYLTFMDLAQENILIPSECHSLNDTYDAIEKSNRKNSNFQKLFTVLLDVLDKYN